MRSCLFIKYFHKSYRIYSESTEPIDAVNSLPLLLILCLRMLIGAFPRIEQSRCLIYIVQGRKFKTLEEGVLLQMVFTNDFNKGKDIVFTLTIYCISLRKATKCNRNHLLINEPR